MVFPHPAREKIVHFLQTLRKQIIQAFESLEPTERFAYKTWKYQEEGQGEIGILRGSVFEKAAVNWSGVGGKKFPLQESEGAFFATGISVITHMTNPHLPTSHFNIRFIETEKKWWFGGGYDLTPMGFPYAEDTAHFHQIAASSLAPFGEEIYSAFAKNAKEYFYIPHRKKERGVGGIFFDHLNTGNFENDYELWQAVGHSFIQAILPIYRQRMDQPFTLEEKECQLYARSHYVEFNLVYDKGTVFGFKSGGNPEAILCSMPPSVKWY